jgi:hypothetical protein
MPKYVVNLNAVLSYTVTVEADSAEEAVDLAFEEAPYEVYGSTHEVSNRLDLGGEWMAAVETCSVVFISPNGVATRLDLNLYEDPARMDARDRAIALALLDVARDRLTLARDS